MKNGVKNEDNKTKAETKKNRLWKEDKAIKK